MLVCGIDPGLGVKSPTGLALIDMKSRAIVQTAQIFTVPGQELRHKIRHISGEIELHTRPYNVALFAIEYFVMRGKGGESLQRLVGGIMAEIPENAGWVEVQNSLVKKTAAGRGQASKLEVGEGCKKFLTPPHDRFIEQFIQGESWDQLDAVAIAITGAKKYGG